MPSLYLAVDEPEDVERDDVEAVVDGANDVLDSQPVRLAVACRKRS